MNSLSPKPVARVIQFPGVYKAPKRECNHCRALKTFLHHLSALIMSFLAGRLD